MGADDLDALLGLLAGSVPRAQPSGPAAAEFADQFGVDVSGITDAQRAALTAELGARTFPAVVQMYVADFLPRVTTGYAALGLPVTWTVAPQSDSDIDVADLVFPRLLPAIARLRSLDPLTTELVRLRGAAAHHCRLCASLREATALEAGGSETLYSQVENFETSASLREAHKSALRYVDALIWTPAAIDEAVAAGVRAHFTAAQCRELTLDVMRNASNKIAVALKADAPHVTEGTETYLVDADGQTVFTSR